MSQLLGEIWYEAKQANGSQGGRSLPFTFLQEVLRSILDFKLELQMSLGSFLTKIVGAFLFGGLASISSFQVKLQIFQKR